MSAVLVRVHLPRSLVERVDRLVAQTREGLGCNVSRAAIIRALLYLYIDNLNPELLSGLKTDAVKRGRPGRGKP
jgi:hypothetical protein